eukprot:CAMPEP_0179985762 /NCGR_PEP_ID=MMETSP0984-20121128/1859_1 /TAXON_ID=483367 /ORGANISM="non described non described, Strain CCMP 2436" /LENGTH=111 /DNA_ID=CAMNT_0021904477 /DNA_START=486 /DNA_END=820 /DNA_ORIENTATION=+
MTPKEPSASAAMWTSTAAMLAEVLASVSQPATHGCAADMSVVLGEKTNPKDVDDEATHCDGQYARGIDGHAAEEQTTDRFPRDSCCRYEKKRCVCECAEDLTPRMTVRVRT